MLGSTRGVLLVGLVGVIACQEVPPAPMGATEEAHVVVAGEPTCAGCRIELRELATLGSPGDPASVRPDGAARICLVARDGTGGFLLSGPVGGGQIFSYGADGRWLRSFGRAGEGPGEFGRNLGVFVGAGDSIYVVDSSQFRVSLLDRDGRFVRSFAVPGPPVAYAALPSRDLLFHFRPSGRPDDARSLFYLMDPTGAEVARFGTSTGIEADIDQWVVSGHATGGFWSGSVWRYELYRWQGPDSLIQTVTREVDWFPPGGQLSPEIYVSEPPPPQLMHITVDDRGWVWTYSWVPDQNWSPNDSRSPTPEWTRANFDTMIEVIDVTAGRVLAAARSDEMLGHACNVNLAYAVVETDAGDTRVQVIQPVFVEGE